MSVTPAIVDTGSYLKDVVVGFIRHVPHAIAFIAVFSSSCSRAYWQRSNFHFVIVTVIFTCEK